MAANITLEDLQQDWPDWEFWPPRWGNWPQEVSGWLAGRRTGCLPVHKDGVELVLVEATIEALAERLSVQHSLELAG